MKIFIVNLAKDALRRDAILQQCSRMGLEAEIISAVDGRLFSADEISALTHPRYAAGMTPGEIGCSLSHHSIYRKIVAENIDCALILEDDVALTASLPDVLAWYRGRQNRQPEVVLLSEADKYVRKPCDVINSCHQVVKVTEAVFTHAYILNKAAAEKLSAFLYPIWLEADRWTLLREYGLVNLKAVIPPVGLHSELSHTSTIWVGDEELIKRKKVETHRSATFKLIKKDRPFWIKLKNAYWRIFVRKFLPIENGRLQ